MCGLTILKITGRLTTEGICVQQRILYITVPATILLDFKLRLSAQNGSIMMTDGMNTSSPKSSPLSRSQSLTGILKKPMFITGISAMTRTNQPGSIRMVSTGLFRASDGSRMKIMLWMARLLISWNWWILHKTAICRVIIL